MNFFQTDFLLIIVRDMVMAYPKLRVVLMSATIETGMYTNYFKTTSIINIEQRVFAVQHFFLEDGKDFFGFEEGFEEVRSFFDKKNIKV